MEKKLVRVPFDIELAKKITNKEIKGKIVTRNGRSARIICFDANCDDNIVALIRDENEAECPKSYGSDGMVFLHGTSDCDLILEIPEHMPFKDGDVLAANDGRPFICTGILSEDGERIGAYCEISSFDKLCFIGGLVITSNDSWCNVNIVHHATEPEKQRLINALKASKAPQAREFLKRFFGIEEKPKCEFKPFDKVLVRDDDEPWGANFFSHKRGKCYYCVTGCWEECIPYNEQTAHLVGTTDNWEE